MILVLERDRPWFRLCVQCDRKLLHCMAGLPGMGMVPGMGVCGSERCNNSEKMERSIKGPDDH